MKTFFETQFEVMRVPSFKQNQIHMKAFIGSQFEVM